MTIIMLIDNDSENENSRDVPIYEAEFLANQYNMLFYEVSSLNHTNVKESIIQFTKEIMVICCKRNFLANNTIASVTASTLSFFAVSQKYSPAPLPKHTR